MTPTTPTLDLAAEAGISTPEYVLIGLVVLAALIFLVRRVYHRKSGCPGCSGCAGEGPCMMVPPALRDPPEGNR
ncbi:hypothetical protein CCR83_13825 [Rhodobacter veldkampii DSM 11550]|uniref:FeoB-associated Cys-rich membrane protein n=1 Tax=Phaeovulum veldkampii DSM 11550 TaxID=1185920 RepID=A0A2T4JIS1_9RHOB|nr:FeoB-associated Cys-rich membrane protein [Phaeovulum veldkampii]MBK5947494.1 hypothetical protein [Phaeovulum veldkampii DSM 11550]NCU19299.1 FeoB-associated Cys-rich membrane protein [Candidatus Falkowbacteria bacterium]PTE17796.1 hypothetical protein C5F46_07085 [Phaeovulum veldkampii DSM 11550]TDQ63341.1 attachment p12 family protein [Phaeovulum veldkampii DSM 11550]